MLTLGGRTYGDMDGLSFKDKKADGLRRYWVSVQVRDLRNGEVEMLIEETALDGGKNAHTKQICHSFSPEAWVELKKLINQVGMI